MKGDAQGPPHPFPQFNDVTSLSSQRQNEEGKGERKRGGFDAHFPYSTVIVTDVIFLVSLCW